MFADFFAANRAAALAKVRAIAEAAFKAAKTAALLEWCKPIVVPCEPLPANYSLRVDHLRCEMGCTFCGAKKASIGCCYFAQFGVQGKSLPNLDFSNYTFEELKSLGIFLRDDQKLLLMAARETKALLIDPFDQLSIVPDPLVQSQADCLQATVKWFARRCKSYCTKEQWILAATAMRLMKEPDMNFIAPEGYKLSGWKQVPCSVEAYELIMSFYLAQCMKRPFYEILAEHKASKHIPEWNEALFHKRMPCAYMPVKGNRKRKQRYDIEKRPTYQMEDVAQLEMAWEALFATENLAVEDTAEEVYAVKSSSPRYSVFHCILAKLQNIWNEFFKTLTCLRPSMKIPTFATFAYAKGVNEIGDVEQFDVSQLPTTVDFLRAVRDKPKQLGNGSILEKGGDSRLSIAKEKEFRKNDIFHNLSFGEKLSSNKFFKQWVNPEGHYSLPINEFTIQSELVKFPGVESDGTPKSTFVVLTRPMEKIIRKVLENGWVEYRAAACSLKITSHLALGTGVQAILVFQQANSSDPLESALSSARVDLSKQKVSMLSLPMINLSLKYASVDLEAWKMMLQVQVTITGSKGLRTGMPIMSIACMEFGELVPNSFTGITHERESWQAILAKDDQERPLRFQSTLNVLETLEKDCAEEIESLNSLVIKPPLSRNTVVRTFDSKANVVTKCPRTMSSRLNFNLVRGDFVGSSSNKPRMSVSEATALGISDVLTTVSYNKVSIPAEQKIGTVLSTFDVMDDARKFNSHLYNKWLLQGYMDANLEVNWAGASNSFTGNSYYIACDAFGRIPAGTAVLDKSIFVQLPGWLIVSRDQSTFKHTFNIREIVGHNFYVGRSSVANLHFVVISASNSQLELSAASFATVIVHAVSLDLECDSFATESYIEYPISGTHLANLDWYLPLETITSGIFTNVSFGLSLGNPVKNGKKEVWSHQAAILSHFLGYGGTIRAQLIVTSSAFVNMCYNVYCYHSPAPLAVQLQIPHSIAWAGQDFMFKIMSPYYAVASRGDNDSFIHVHPFSGVEAPKDHTSDVDIYLHVKGIDVNMQMVKTINYSNTFGWFSIRAKTPLKKETTLNFVCPSFFSDFSTTIAELTVRNYVNPFSLLCAASGMHQGKVNVHFEFLLTNNVKLSEMKGRSVIACGSGPDKSKHYGNVKVYHMLENHAVVPFEFSSFAGPTPSRELSEYSNWITFETEAWAQFQSLTVSVEVLPGFRFYGKTCTPLS